MKIAISGKGGTGKTTIAAALALLLAGKGKKVLALDADPDANLAAALGMPAKLQKEIVPIAQHKALIEERTGAKVKQYGQMFKLNPEVADIADTFAIRYNGIALLVLGAIEERRQRVRLPGKRAGQGPRRRPGALQKRDPHHGHGGRNRASGDGAPPEAWTRCSSSSNPASVP